MTQNIIEVCDEIERSADNDPVVRVVLEKAFTKAGNDMMEVCNMLKSVTKAIRLQQ